MKTGIWLASEIILNLAGTDTLADYSEFIFDAQRFTETNYIPVVLLQTNSREVKAQTAVSASPNNLEDNFLPYSTLYDNSTVKS